MRSAPRLRSVLVGGLAASLLLLGAAPAAAHTETDLVAVPAGQAAQVTLAPTHGCGDAGTVEVVTRVPVAGATPTEVPGWTHTSADDGEGNTIVEWTGGLLPTDQVGAFPVTFTTPEAPGEMLTFPFIQVCEDGEELAWIDGDPAGERPAPRLLVLAAGAEPAATIDDVPADAPGRDQLGQIVDVDNPQPAPETTTTTAPTTTTAAPTTTTADAATDPDDQAAGAAAEDPADGGSVAPIVAGAALVGAAVVAGGIVVARRRGSA